MFASDKTRLNQVYVEQKFAILDEDGDGFFDLDDYKRALQEDPNFFNFYDLFNFGGTTSIELEKEIIEHNRMKETGFYEEINEQELY